MGLAFRKVLLRGDEQEAAIAYSLRDQFSTADAAPITTPRTCEPGPGVAAITDSGTNVSISNGDMVVAGNGTWNQNGAVFTVDGANGITRTAGLLVEFDVEPTITGIANGQMVGLTSAASFPAATNAANIYAVRFYNDDNLDVYVNGVITADVAAYANTAYRVRFELKATGCTIKISGGAFGTLGEAWTTLLDTGNDSTSELFLYITSRQTNPFNYAEVRVYPQST